MFDFSKILNLRARALECSNFFSFVSLPPMQFLDPQNVAGQTLLRLTARGSAIIAELLRLSAHIPPIFKLEDKAVIAKRYHEILLDFSYVSKADAYEQRIEKDPVRQYGPSRRSTTFRPPSLFKQTPIGSILCAYFSHTIDTKFLKFGYFSHESYHCRQTTSTLPNEQMA